MLVSGLGAGGFGFWGQVYGWVMSMCECFCGKTDLVVLRCRISGFRSSKPGGLEQLFRFRGGAVFRTDFIEMLRMLSL